MRDDGADYTVLRVETVWTREEYALLRTLARHQGTNLGAVVRQACYVGWEVLKDRLGGGGPAAGGPAP